MRLGLASLVLLAAAFPPPRTLAAGADLPAAAAEEDGTPLAAAGASAGADAGGDAGFPSFSPPHLSSGFGSMASGLASKAGGALSSVASDAGGRVSGLASKAGGFLKAATGGGTAGSASEKEACFTCKWTLRKAYAAAGGKYASSGDLQAAIVAACTEVPPVFHQGCQTLLELKKPISDLLGFGSNFNRVCEEVQLCWTGLMWLS